MLGYAEADYENAVIELFTSMGYTHIYAPDMNREDYSSPLLDPVLQDSLVRLNRNLPMEAIREALGKLNAFDTGSLVQKNMAFMEYLQNGIEVKYFLHGEESSALVRLIDYTRPENNTFHVVNQYTYIENCKCQYPNLDFLKKIFTVY